MKKKIICMITVLLMLLSLIPGQIFAEGSDVKMSQMEFSATYHQTAARGMLALINDMRTDGNAWVLDENEVQQNLGVLNTLTYDYNLEQIAMQRAKEIAVKFSHIRPNGERCFSATYNGTSSNGENIIAGTNSADKAFEIWCEEDQPYAGQGHRRNMLDARWNAIGIASVTVNGCTYWVQEFRTRNSGADQTPAEDSAKTVTVDFAENAVSNARITLSKQSVTVNCGASTVLPSADVEVLLIENWRSGYVKCTDAPTWTSSDEEVARIEDGRVLVVKGGTAVLTAEAFGATATVTVNVSHVWDGGIVTTEPTEATAGSKMFTCQGCGSTKTETIPKLPHTHRYDAVVTAPTYTEQGYTTHTCACGDSYVDGYVSALGDFNGDSAVNNDDLVMLLRHVAKIQMVTDKAVLTKLDINKDGKINAKDITLLTQSLETAG